MGLLEVLAAHGGPVVTRWEQAEQAALAMARALALLPLAAGELLAVFAARVTGDPHAFDARRPAGALLLAALADWLGAPSPGLRDSEARALLLGAVNLEVDGVSSTVLAAFLDGCAHPVIAAMARQGGGWPLPLSAVRQADLAPGRGRPVYIVENPQVFESLVRSVAAMEAGRRPMLLCTGGFLSAAGVSLLERLHRREYALRYGGDFDRNGLSIARWLIERYPGLSPWRMGPQDYLAALGGQEPGRLPAADRDWLRQVEGPLAATARIMAERGAPAYQESLVPSLLTDLMEQ